MNIGRIRNGVVVNIEIVDEQWVDDGSSDDVLIPYTDEQPAFIGLGWSEVDGFEQPSATEAPVADPGSPDS